MTKEDRIVGAMLGLACGDALGAPAEFKSKAEVESRFGELREMVGGGMWQPGEWTDDTGMALCLAEGILAAPDDPLEETGKRFLQWRENAKDVGTTISAALSGFDGDWPKAAQNTPQAQSGKAAGNGSLMRVLPVALAYGGDVVTMEKWAARQSAMTHWDEQAEMCCIIYCMWVNKLLDGEDLKSAWESELAQSRQRAGKAGDDLAPGSSTLSDEFWARLQNIENLTYEQLQPSGYAGYVVECLEAAVWCCLNCESLEGVLVKVVNLAGESDTMAAVAGGAAGAFWGKDEIPARWLDKLLQRDELKTIALRLAALRRHQEIYGTRGLPKFNFDEVGDGLFAGRNPLSARDVELMQGAGITHILDLREPKEWASPHFGSEALAEIERRGIERLSAPVLDMGAPTSDGLELACQFLEENLDNQNARVYVHCRAGMERTAAVLIAYHAREFGVSYDEALAKLREGRPIFRPLPNQERAVRQWLEAK